MAIFVISLNWYTRWRSPGADNKKTLLEWKSFYAYHGTPDRIYILVVCIKQQKTRPKGLIFSCFGTPDRIRTYDLLLRKQALYPAELRVHMWM